MVGCNINFNVDVNKCLSGLQAKLRLGRPKSGIKKLEKKMARLRVKRDDIKSQIDQAEHEGRIPTKEVSQWLLEVETLEGKVATIKQDFQNIGCFSCYYCCSINRRVAEKLGEINELMSQAGALDPIARVGPHEPTLTLPISHRPPIGIESYVKDIVGYIDGGGEDKIIGIYGMGGVGKTTILNSIQLHYLNHRKKFDRVISVVASKDCQLKRLQMDIAESLDLKTLLESDDERTRGDKLFSYLKNRNCLLLLDDIWGRLDLRLLGMAHPSTEEGQQQQLRKVVVLTTRSETVCGDMKAEKKIKVKCLNPDEAWKLFEQNYEGNVLSSDAGIKLIARKLVKECAGLPLALVTVAGAMTGKKSFEAWNDALHQIKDKHEWTTNGIPEDSMAMYKAFKLSYDSLKNDSIRECLLCCALWREDYEIHKFDELIPCWIGCGIIREFNVINEAFAKGCSYLDALMAASLLEPSSKLYHYGEKYVKMHDVIRDMALLMVSGLEGNKRKWIVKTEIGLRDLPKQEVWQEAERASFRRNRITSLSEYVASTFPKLSMLILQGNNIQNIIPPSLFASMPHLTYLDIASCDLTEFPMEICTLTELQYLDLSYNRITILPDEFGWLGKLEYLILRCCAIQPIPNGIISKLSMFRWLDIREIPWPIGKLWLNELKCFKGRRQLSVGICIDATTHNIEQLNMLPNVSIWYLSIYGDLPIDGGDASNINEDYKVNFSTPQWCYNVSDNLESLTMNCVAVDILIFPESKFRSLKILHFLKLQLLEKVLLNGDGLDNLRELTIQNCPMLKDVSWVLQLPSLNLLKIIMCPRMEELISDTGNSNSISSIKILILLNLEKLTRIANQPLHFPYLECIRVQGCPELKKLSFDAEISESRLKKILCVETWWYNLEWDDVTTKNSFIPHFVPRFLYLN